MRRYDTYKYLLLTIAIFISMNAVAQTTSDFRSGIDSVVLNFRFDKAIVDSGYLNNRSSLKRLNELLSVGNIDSVSIITSSSVDGSARYNNQLSTKRAQAIKGYIVWKYPQIDQHIISTHALGENWDGLYALAENDAKLPNREKVLSTIKADVNPATKEWRLKQIGRGETWRYIEHNYLRYLRSGATCVVLYRKPEPLVVEVIPADENIQHHQEVAPAPIEVDTVNTIPIIEPQIQETVIAVLPEIEYTKKPLFALKTNLLFDLATALNVEIEVPIGERFSIAGEWIFPWWLWEKKQYCLQVLSGNIEGRYWFGNRTDRPRMTGWFAGLYAGAGLYDIEWGDKGYQGEFFIAAGLSGGYAHTINKSGSLRMEYSLGVGYMKTEYREYEPKENGEILAWKRDGRYTWIGPTRAKISLVWMINRKAQKGGMK